MGLGASIGPWEMAVRYLRGKIPVASLLRSKEWAGVAQGLRNGAQLSAGVANLQVMQGIQDKLVEWVELGRADPERSFMDRGKFVAEMRDLLGAPEGDSGDIADITAERRLRLIYDVQTTDAMEAGRWQVGQDADILGRWPAQEFLRVESRRVPREDWRSRWVEAGGVFYQGRMIALKTDPVWENLSVFGKPWPPFDFGSGMGVEDVGRREAIALGLIQPATRLQPAREDYAGRVQASVEGLSEDKISALREQFGEQVVVEDGKARWKGI